MELAALGGVTEARLARALGGGRSFEAGRAYFRQGRATILTQAAHARGWTVWSRVRGDYSPMYEQTTRLESGPGEGEFRVEGECSCPVGWNCKHIAAALLQWRAEGDPADPYRRPPELDVWLGQIGELARRHDETYARSLRQVLVYVLDADSAEGSAHVRPLSVKLDRHGGPIGKPTLQDAAAANQRTPARFLRAADLQILRRLASHRTYGPNDRYNLVGADGAGALTAMGASGRCRWRTIDGPLLGPGPAIEARLEWASEPDRRQRPRLVPQPASSPGDCLVALRLQPPQYVDVARRLIGPLVTGVPEEIEAVLLKAPAVPPGLAEEVAERLAAAFANVSPRPPVPGLVEGFETLRPAPAPYARLEMARVDPVPAWQGGYGRWRPSRPAPIDTPVVRLAFDYGPVRFDHGDGAQHVVVETDGRKVRIARDPAAEARAVARLTSVGLKRLDRMPQFIQVGEERFWFGLAADATPAAFAPFVLAARPALVAEGWTVEVEDGFPLILARADEDAWSFEVSAAADEGAGGDWFDLHLGVRIDGERLDLLPLLIRLLGALPNGDPQQALAALIDSRRAGGLIEVGLADGRILPLPLARIAPILEGLLLVWRSEPERAGRLSVYEAGAFEAFQTCVGETIAWSGAGRLEGLARESRTWRERAPTPLPEGFTARLRPYQQTGLDWLQMLARAGFGGLLADDMGLGKTVQALAHLCVQKAAGRLPVPALVVAPTSVLPNWRAEAGHFAPDLRTLVLRGPDRGEAMARIDEHDLVITSYPLLARDREALVGRAWSVVILDEGQVIRNPATAAAKAAFGLEAGQRIILSGTPVENHLGDAWSLMRFLNPGLLGDAKTFARRFRVPIERQRDREAEARLESRLAPFILRREKKEVAADLPPRTQIDETVELTAGQADLYEATRLIMYDKVRDALASRGLARSSVVVLDALLKLRQVCCDPRLVKTASAKARASGSAKLERLLELIEQLRAEKRKALLFSQFTSMLKLIQNELSARRIDHAWLTGDTIDRAAPVRRFQSGEVDLFLISLKAGGAGLNLTSADTVILYDPWWNPAVEAQAIDRAHRIGQVKPVFVHRLIAAGTIEQKMLALQARKRQLAAALWSEDAGAMRALGEDDIRALFD